MATVTARHPVLFAHALLLATLVLSFGCDTDSHGASVKAPSGADDPKASPPPRTKREDPLGPDGELRESDEVLAGLTLPMGLEPRRATARRHIYGTSVRQGKVLKYFGQRLITGQVDRLSNGAIYREAIPRGVQGTPVKLDVSILDTPGGCRVEIVERPPAPKNPLPRAEVSRRAEEDWKRLD